MGSLVGWVWTQPLCCSNLAALPRLGQAGSRSSLQDWKGVAEPTLQDAAAYFAAWAWGGSLAKRVRASRTRATWASVFKIR